MHWEGEGNTLWLVDDLGWRRKVIWAEVLGRAAGVFGTGIYVSACPGTNKRKLQREMEKRLRAEQDLDKA